VKIEWTLQVGVCLTYRDKGVGIANDSLNVGSGGTDDGADGVVGNSNVARLARVGVRLWLWRRGYWRGLRRLLGVK